MSFGVVCSSWGIVGIYAIPEVVRSSAYMHTTLITYVRTHSNIISGCKVTKIIRVTRLRRPVFRTFVAIDLRNCKFEINETAVIFAFRRRWGGALSVALFGLAKPSIRLLLLSV